jgi:hypothetical protein
MLNGPIKSMKQLNLPIPTKIGPRIGQMCGLSLEAGDYIMNASGFLVITALAHQHLRNGKLLFQGCQFPQHSSDHEQL